MFLNKGIYIVIFGFLQLIFSQKNVFSFKSVFVVTFILKLTLLKVFLDQTVHHENEGETSCDTT